jgi:shikimate dehydrogenase
LKTLIIGIWNFLLEFARLEFGFNYLEFVTMKLYGLIGFPLSHSFSKSYFAQKFLDEGIKGCEYELFPIETIDDLPKLLQQNPDLCGLNITIPYKQLAIPFLDDTSNLPLQACNCVKIEDGKLIGFNTDVLGFEKSFKPLLQPHHKAALVLGTGGASLAVQYILQKNEIDFKVVSRDANNGITYQELDKKLMDTHTVIINTTPLGTYPNVDDCPQIPYELITKAHYCYDLVYNPPKTKFLLQAEAKGAATKNGGDMLRIQAEESWRIWN